MERIKTAGLWGLAIAFFIVMLPISVISFVITTKLMFLFLGIALMAAIVGYIVFLPATVAASLTDNEDNPKFVFGAAVVVAVLIIAGPVARGPLGRASHQHAPARSRESGCSAWRLLLFPALCSDDAGVRVSHLMLAERERRKLETHPRTGAAQLVEVRETVEEAVIPVYVQAEIVESPSKSVRFTEGAVWP